MAMHFEHFMKESGIKTYWGHRVLDVTLSGGGFLYSAVLASQRAQERELTATCTALLLCHSSALPDKDVFTAINESGLVFDGGLVVDHCFRTVDPCIFGVCDYTKFSRMHREALPHARCNPRELGAYVALKILEQHLDPTSTGDVLSLSAAPPGSSGGRGGALPVFALPRSVLAELPNQVQYFKSSLPQQVEDAQLLPTSRGDPKRECLLKVSELGTVVEFIYLGQDVVESRNLSQLPGRHEAALNGAVHAYETKEPEDTFWDWISYFRGSWAAAVYHDKYPSLLQTMKATLRGDKGMQLLVQRVLEMSVQQPDNAELAKHRRDFTGPRGEGLPESTVAALSADVNDHLKKHKATLRQYHLSAAAPPASSGKY